MSITSKAVLIPVILLSFIHISSGNYIKVKRNDGSDIASTLDLAFAPLQRDEAVSAEISSSSSPSENVATPPSKSEEEQNEENLQKHELERMVVMQNLNYLDDVITNLEAEKQNLETLWKSSTSNSEAPLHRAAKSLWQKTSKQILVLNEKKKELLENLKTLTFGEKLQKFIQENETGSLETSTTDSSKTESTTSSISKAICQFFVFGTLFGVVITITVCTCFLQPRQQRRSRQCRVASISNLNPSRIPEPFDYSKPCFLKADSTGKFYASPIDGEEIPPLPTYEAALALPRSPSDVGGGDLHDITTLDSVTVIDSIETPYPKEQERTNSERF